MTIIFPNTAAQQAVRALIEKAQQATKESKFNIHKNKIDPFPALIDSMLQGIPLEQWLAQEKIRQNQKTLQNAIGNFHQTVIASFDGWENLGTGKVLDVRNQKQKMIAEIKNKFNTTKGNHKVQIYRDIANKISEPAHVGFTGYYVEIIPSGRGAKAVYDKPFVTSDNNKNGMRVEQREDVRIIDGKSFYKIVTGQTDALEQLYQSLPAMIRQAIGTQNVAPENEDLFLALFEKAFG